MLEIFKSVVKRIKFEHVFAMAMFIPIMILLVFGMNAGDEAILTTVTTIIATGFGTVIAFFYKKDDTEEKK